MKAIERLAQVAEYKASGMRMGAWCEENGVSRRTLSHWVREYELLEDAAVPEGAPWVEVSFAGGPRHPAQPIVVTAGGVRVEVPAGCAEADVRAVLGAVVRP